jgi:hypothetical protein
VKHDVNIPEKIPEKDAQSVCIMDVVYWYLKPMNS